MSRRKLLRQWRQLGHSSTPHSFLVMPNNLYCWLWTLLLSISPIWINIFRRFNKWIAFIFALTIWRQSPSLRPWQDVIPPRSIHWQPYRLDQCHLTCCRWICGPFIQFICLTTYFKQLICIGSLQWVQIQHPLYGYTQFGTVVYWQWCWLTFYYLFI